MKFESRVFDPKDVVYYDDCLLILEGKSYKLITADGTTITFQLGFWERAASWLRASYWKLREAFGL